MFVTRVNFPGEAKRTKNNQNFQESFLKIPQEHTQIYRRKKYYKRPNPGRFSQNCEKHIVTIFQEEQMP